MLSGQDPRAYRPTHTIAVVGVVLGVASVIMPYFAAVFLVPSAFVCGLVSFSRGQRNLGGLGMILAVVGLVGIIAVSQQLTQITRDTFTPLTYPAVAPQGPIVTMEEYNRVQDGMSPDQVMEVIGAPGKELSRSEVSGITSTMRSWQNSDGSSMTAMFQRDRLISKSQLRLR